MAAVPRAGHRPRLPAGRSLRAARAPAGAGPRRLVARPRRADRPRVRDRHELRLHDDRADPDRRRHLLARDRTAPRRLRVALARADEGRRHPPPRRARRGGREPARVCSASSRASTGGIAYDFVGAVAAGAASRACRSLGASLAELPAILDAVRPDELILTEADFDERTVLDVVEHAHRRGVKVRLAPSTTELLVQKGEYVPGQRRAALRAAPADPRRLGLAREAHLRPRRAARCSSSSGCRSGCSIALAIKLDSRGPVFYVDRRVGVGEREFGMLKFRTMVADAAQQQRAARGGERGVGRAVQDPRRPARDPRRPRAAAVLDRRAAAARQRPARADEPRRPAAAARSATTSCSRTGIAPATSCSRDDRSVADLGPLRPLVRRSRPARLHLPRELVDLARHLDHREDDSCRARGRGAY